MLGNIKAWKSTIVGLVFMIGIGLGVYSGKLSETALLALIPGVMLVLTNVFKEDGTKKS